MDATGNISKIITNVYLSTSNLCILQRDSSWMFEKYWHQELDPEKTCWVMNFPDYYILYGIQFISNRPLIDQSRLTISLSHRIHGKFPFISSYINGWHFLMVNLGKYMLIYHAWMLWLSQQGSFFTNQDNALLWGKSVTMKGKSLTIIKGKSLKLWVEVKKTLPCTV